MQVVTESVRRLGTDWVNWYLLEDGGITLVDCGFAGYHDQLPAALEAAGHGPGDVDAVVLTHYHADHVGSAERIRAETGATVWAPALEAAAIRGDARVPAPKGLLANAWRPRMLRYLLHAARNDGLGLHPVGDLRTYGEGDVLDVPGGLAAIHTPGHTAGHHSLLHEELGVLFAGDALGTLDLTSSRTGPQVPPVNEDHGRARASLARLRDVDAGLVLCGHGEPFRGSAAEAVDRALAA